MTFHRNVRRISHYMAVVEHYSGRFTDVAACLSCDHTRLTSLGFSNDYFTVLEDAFRVPEDEIYGSGDCALAVELPVRVDNTAKSAVTLSATACPPFGPAVFSIQMGKLKLTDGGCKERLDFSDTEIEAAGDFGLGWSITDKSDSIGDGLELASSVLSHHGISSHCWSSTRWFCHEPPCLWSDPCWDTIFCIQELSSVACKSTGRMVERSAGTRWSHLAKPEDPRQIRQSEKLRTRDQHTFSDHRWRQSSASHTARKHPLLRGHRQPWI
ncbi:unnamed protein product [Thlaspi arvense]|uniref:Uncharacterized protein n=1 Tax=Thlaspi arvense TaxID=13288 RepID=A0AAU9S4P8_THLAR|nr:unnamed protein product [Thlaspi arvense]